MLMSANNIVVTCLIALALALVAIPASAKGPESAVITGPGLDGPQQLMEGASEEELTLLMEQTGLWYGTGDLPAPVEEAPGDLGTQYAITWISFGPPGLSVEDRTIVQHLFVQSDGSMLIHTPEQASLQGWGEGVIGWFVAPPGLADTLVRMGLPPLEAPTTQASGGIKVLSGLVAAVFAGLAWVVTRRVRTRRSEVWA